MLRIFIPLALLLATQTGLAGEMETAMKEVETIRGLAFESPVATEVLSRDRLREVLEAQISRDLSMPVDQQMEMFEALTLLDSSERALDQLMDVYESQVLAFYDPRTHKYYTFDRAPGGEAMAAMMAEVVAIHELTHALQDQRFDAGRKLAALESNWDAQMAYHAVLEGEATLVMLASMFSRLGIPLEEVAASDEMLASISDAAALNPGFSADAPPYFVESMKFPYLEGLGLVVRAFRRDGWKGVDALHARPPASSEEVLRPDLYFARLERERASCPSAGKGSLSTTLGEFHWRFLLGEEAAAGWSSDCVTLDRVDGRWVVEGTSRWDGEKDAEEFAAALRRRLEEHERAMHVRREGREVAFRWSAPQPGVEGGASSSSPSTSARASSQARTTSW